MTPQERKQLIKLRDHMKTGLLLLNRVLGKEAPPVEEVPGIPEPPFPPIPVNNNNAKREGWLDYYRGVNKCPFPEDRKDLLKAYNEGWNTAERHNLTNGGWLA